MGYVNIDSLCWEIQAIMNNNYRGTPAQRFSNTKKFLIEHFKDIINQNKVDMINEFKESQKE